MPGIHNVLNALATIAIADELSVELGRVRESLKNFTGVQRRFTIVGEQNGVTIVDDYGHHPAEVEATLEAASRAYDRRIVVAFQPHRYTRTLHCFDELSRAFNRADVLLLCDVYAAGEDPIPGADSESLAEAVRARGHRDVTYVGDLDALMGVLATRLQPGDVLITLGAGNITRVGRDLLAQTGGEASHGA